MKNILLAFCIAFLSLNLFSNENSLRQGSGVYEFHFFNVTNPEGFVTAIEAFDSSSYSANTVKSYSPIQKL